MADGSHDPRTARISGEEALAMHALAVGLVIGANALCGGRLIRRH